MTQYPSMSVFVDSHIADTMHLTNEEHGVYCRLLMFAWRTPECALPNDDVKLARMLRLSAKKWAALKPTVMALWTLEGERWRQASQTRERQFVEEKVEKRRASGKLGGRPKSLQSNDMGKPNGSENKSKAKAPTPTLTGTKHSTVEGETPASGDLASHETLEAALREAAGLQSDPSPSLYNTSPIEGLLNAGLDLHTHILPSLRAAAKAGRRGRTWRYYVPAIQDAMESRQKAAAGLSKPLSTAPAAPAEISDPIWDQLVERYTSTNHWMLPHASAPPDDPATKVPVHILEKHGFRRAVP